MSNDAYIGSSPLDLNVVQTRYRYLATASQTTFNAVYAVGYIDVYRNGLKLDTSEFTATNGTSVVLAVGADLNDIIEIVGQRSITPTDVYTKAQVDAKFSLPRAYLSGMVLSNNVTITKLDVSAGACKDSTNTTDINLASAITAGLIQTSGSWAAGSNQNKLDTGARANSTWYHVHAIRNNIGGLDDWLFSLSVNAPTLPANYTQFRRIGSVKTDGSGNIVAFTQDGGYFRWAASVLDVNSTNPGTSAVTATLASVPTAVNVSVIANAFMVDTTSGASGNSMYVSDLAANDEVPTSGGVPLHTMSYPTVAAGVTGQVSEMIVIRTNTSAQIRYRIAISNANVTVRFATLGWMDPRGKDV